MQEKAKKLYEVKQCAARILKGLLASLMLLTRLPIAQFFTLTTLKGEDYAQSAWAWPVIGALCGGFMVAFAQIFLALGFSPQISAAMVLPLGILMTGALHEDGLADSTDGLFGGTTPKRRLEIMKDSQIGSYGVLALVSAFIIKWLSISFLLETQSLVVCIIAIGAISRAPMAVIMAILPNARQAGLSQNIGQPSLLTALSGGMIAIIIAHIICLYVGFGFGLLLLWIIALSISTICLILLARAKIGGQTGDILGASQQVNEITCLLLTLAYAS